jgi:hypothetical protein
MVCFFTEQNLLMPFDCTNEENNIILVKSFILLLLCNIPPIYKFQLMYYI